MWPFQPARWIVDPGRLQDRGRGAGRNEHAAAAHYHLARSIRFSNVACEAVADELDPAGGVPRFGAHGAAARRMAKRVSAGASSAASAAVPPALSLSASLTSPRPRRGRWLRSAWTPRCSIGSPPTAGWTPKRWRRPSRASRHTPAPSRPRAHGELLPQPRLRDARSRNSSRTVQARPGVKRPAPPPLRRSPARPQRWTACCLGSSRCRVGRQGPHGRFIERRTRIWGGAPSRPSPT